MKPHILLLTLIPAFVACNQGQSGSQTTPPVAAASEPAATDGPLTQAWVAEGLKTPEAVCYDPLNDVLYVSNINEGPGEKDNNGFISRLSPEGKILNNEWVKGLSAPKGMAISNGNLYVSDLTDLVEINIAEGKITQRFNAPKAQFLNDVASDAAGNIYISDSGTGEIYRLNKGKLEVWVKNAAIQGPNGLFIKDNSLLVGVESKILALNLETKALTTFIDSTSKGQGADGLVSNGADGYFISNWVGSTWLVSPAAPTQLLLNTEADTINAADLEYIPGRRLLLVPTFFDNRVVAYKVKE